MKKFLTPLMILLVIIVVALTVVSLLFVRSAINNEPIMTSAPTTVPEVTQTESPEDVPVFSVIAENLEIPWALVFLPDKSILFTERPGRVRLIDKEGQLRSSPVAEIKDVRAIGEGGLLGIAIHPNFLINQFVYLYYTYSEVGDQTLNRVVRFKFDGETLIDRTVIVDAIPGAPNHNGGRIKFGPDNLLYITTGDAQNPSLAQDKNSLAGKILRVTDTGAPAPGNPFNNRTFSYGHRNAQGIAWDKNSRLWATEHGRSGLLSGLDELNLIEPGKNYGWQTIQGDEQRAGMETPKLNSGSDTWAPAGAAFIDSSLFFAGLRGQTLYEAVMIGEEISLKEHFKTEFGRIRDVVVGPDNLLYITTSNRDGRGNPVPTDDKIIRVNPKKL